MFQSLHRAFRKKQKIFTYFLGKKMYLFKMWQLVSFPLSSRKKGNCHII